jgi:hypothetical protein
LGAGRGVSLRSPEENRPKDLLRLRTFSFGTDGEDEVYMQHEVEELSDGSEWLWEGMGRGSDV